MARGNKLVKSLKTELLRRAENRFPKDKLGPAGTKQSLVECFTMDKLNDDYNILMLWYNVGKDTHVETVTFDHTKIKPKGEQP